MSFYGQISTRYGYLGRGILNAYSQVFFSDNPWFALLLIAATFLAPVSGMAGLSGALISILMAHWLGYDKGLISKGVLSYNVVLVTLPLGLYFEPGLPLYLTTIFATLLTFFITVAFQGWFSKYRLPFLSWPFLIGLWIVMLAVRSFSALNLSLDAVYEWNKLYEWGGIGLVNGYQWISNLPLPDSIATYLSSLGAVFFQYTIPGGLLVALGLLIYSRIAFSLSLLGFFSALLFYRLLGVDISSLNYTYIGFNFILSAIAIGGFFLVPSWASFLWVLILVPIVTFLTVSMESLFANFQLSVYALPFNLIVPLFLYVLQFRKKKGTLQEVLVQHNSPERNLYAVANYKQRLGRATAWLFRLPFRGTWMVSQGHNGKITHQSEWRHAWDFVKTDLDGKTYKDPGYELTDYYCYDKPVCTAAAGIVDSVVDGVIDNPPGDVNTRQNWGNTVIVRHWEGLYSKYSHLKAGSISVVPGQYLASGQEIGFAGNSGRSPEPHLHFQFQTTPYIDSVTLDYPFGHYLVRQKGKTQWKSYDRPSEKEFVSNPELNSLLLNAFHFIPGQRIHVECHSLKVKSWEWEVRTDIYNNSCLADVNGSARAWFVNDGQVFYFTHYEGSRRDPLYLFFLAAFRIPLVYDEGLLVEDSVPLMVSARKWMRWIQDWVAPFVIFLETHFSLTYAEQDDDLDPEWITLNSHIVRKLGKDALDETRCQLMIPKSGLLSIRMDGVKGCDNQNGTAELKLVER